MSGRDPLIHPQGRCTASCQLAGQHKYAPTSEACLTALPADAEPLKPSHPAPSCRTGNSSLELGGHLPEKPNAAEFLQLQKSPPDTHTVAYGSHIPGCVPPRGMGATQAAMPACDPSQREPRADGWWKWRRSHGSRQGSPRSDVLIAADS